VAAIALAVTDKRASGHIYTVGEQETLSVAERVSSLSSGCGSTHPPKSTPGQFDYTA